MRDDYSRRVFLKKLAFNVACVRSDVGRLDFTVECACFVLLGLFSEVFVVLASLGRCLTAAYCSVLTASRESIVYYFELGTLDF